MSDSASAARWNARYAAAEAPGAVAAVLHEQAGRLPRTGMALDLASGLGANAMFLAHRGLKVEAWDISAVALAKLSTFAATQGLAIATRAVDLTESDRLREYAGRFDVVVVVHYLDRAITEPLGGLVKLGGLLLYQTFTVESTGGPANPAYRLDVNELLSLFRGYRTLAYREDGPGTDGLAGQAYWVGQRIL